MNYVLGFAFDKNNPNLIALLEKQRPERFKGLLNAIGGKIEQNEIPIKAMIREFKEETGVETTPENWNIFGKIIGSNFIINCFKTHDLDLSELKTTTDEEIFITRVSSLKLKKTKVIDNLHWLIPLALDDKAHYSTINYG